MDNYKKKFEQLHPEILYLEHRVSPEIHRFLVQNQWITDSDQILKIEKPGEGNMNFVARVITSQRSFILKQSRPWVQKYPQVAAPIDRTHTEHRFYKLIAQNDFLKSQMPALLGYDNKQFLLALEDLGEGADFTRLYQKRETLNPEDLEALVKFISHLHALEIAPSEREKIGHPEMKRLNHEHIFVFPFMVENGFDLDSIQVGLQAVSIPIKQDKGLKNKILDLGEIYLNTFDTLVQGDYYPGSWLKVSNGLRVIDPEFAFVGRAEFELGVMVAHLKMSEQPTKVIQRAIQLYQRKSGFDENMFWAFVGVEILRRIIGLAQLPLSLSLNEKQALLQEAITYINQY